MGSIPVTNFMTDAKFLGYTTTEFIDAQKSMQGKTLVEILGAERLAELEKDYYVGFSHGVLTLGAKHIHVSASFEPAKIQQLREIAMEQNIAVVTKQRFLNEEQ